MKKIPLLLLLLATIGFNAFSQITLANWDGKAPISVVAGTGSTVTQNAVDPAVGTNHVLKYVRAASASSFFTINTDSAKMLQHSQVSLDVYADSVKSIMIVVKNAWGDSASVTNSFAVSKATWKTYTFNLSGSLSVHPYGKIMVYPDPAATAASNYYFDNVKLVGLDANADSAIIAKETFGTADCRQTGQGGLEPPYEYPSNTFTYKTRYASGYFYNSIHGSSTAAIDSFRGNDTWYAKTLYDSLPKMYPGKQVFTLLNGRWTDQYAFWASTAGGAGSSESYAGNSGANNILMAPSGRYSFSWDTIQIDNINISGFKNLSFGFGAYLREATKKHGIFVSYSIDGGAWTKFCDTTAYINFPSAASTWKFVSTPKLASTVVGSKMSIRFNTLPVNTVDAARYYLDDMTLMGTPINITGLKVNVPTNDTIKTAGGTLQLTAKITATNAYDTTVMWSVVNGTGAATISSTGLLKGSANGIVYAKACAKDASGLKDSVKIVLTNQIIPFNLVTFAGDIPAGDSIVTISGKKYLKVRLNGWSTAFPIVPLTFYKNTTVKFSYKYGQDTSSVASSKVQAFVQFMQSVGTYENFPITDKPASDTIKTVTQLLKADTVNQLQLAAQLTSGSWSAIAGPFLYISQMQFTTPLDLTTLNGDVPAGDTIVTMSGVKYLKVRVNAWSTSIPVAQQIFTKNESVKFSYQYVQDTSSVTAASVQAFVQFMKSDGTTYGNIPVTDKPASTTIKSVTSALKADTINLLQLAVQQTSGSWSAVAGPILYVSQMTFTYAVTGITVAGGSTITTAGGTLQLTATVAPTNATVNTVTWSVDKPAVATISASGLLTAVSNGTVVVTATAADGSKVTGTLSVVVTGQTGIGSLASQQFSVYPNPANEVITINGVESGALVKIYSITGQLVISRLLSNGTMDISSLKSGIYMVKVAGNMGVAKLMKR